MAEPDASLARHRFRRIAGAGMAFQGGTAAVDSATVVASLVHLLTGSALAVGYASAVLRLGWVLTQLPVGWLAERSPRRMPFYVFGAFGRAAAAAAIAVLLWWGSDWPQFDWPPVPLALGFLALWTVARRRFIRWPRFPGRTTRSQPFSGGCGARKRRGGICSWSDRSNGTTLEKYVMN